MQNNKERLLLHHANLLSFQEGAASGTSDSILINGSIIEAIGSYETLKPLAGRDALPIDVQGKTIMPGFHDTHIHIWKVGSLASFILDVRAASGLEEMLSFLEQYRISYPETTWITARGFNEAGWKEGRMPDRKDLDRIIPDQPVFLIRTCAHIAVCNSRALEICGITKKTEAPAGGAIYVDERGEPNGILSETALGLVTAHIPPYNKDQLKTMIRTARTELYRYGITAATDPAVDPLLLETYMEMEKDAELGFRLQAIPILLPDGGASPFPIPEPYSSGMLTVNTVKFFADGGLSGATAALKRAYKGTGDKGILRLQEDQYLSLCRAAHEKGLGVATHAIGDEAIGLVIRIYRQLGLSFPDSLRRIEHLGLPEPQHLRDMADHHIAASMQTIFVSELGKNFIRRLDDDYLQRCYPVRSALRAGILVALSSDAPVVRSFNPLKGIQAAITRMDDEGHSIAPSEAIGIHEALQAYTASAAEISRTPEWGTLQPGRQADLIILDRSPLDTSPAALTDIRVDATYVAGAPVWTR